jgi:hypothetical protein
MIAHHPKHPFHIQLLALVFGSKDVCSLEIGAILKTKMIGWNDIYPDHLL